MNKRILLIAGLFTVFSIQSVAQIQFNGSIDVGLRSGGSNSSFVKNGIESEFKYLHLDIPQVNLFLFAPINDDFFAEARLQSDTWGTGTLSDPRFTLANITWAKPGNSYAISAGRFVNPVGFYSKRNLIQDRTIFELPLSYSYFTNISDQRGYWPLAGEQGAYTSSDVGLTTIYFGGYATGVLLDWQIKPDRVRLETAVTSAAPASAENYTNLANAAILTHLTLNPNIYWQLGVSGSYGSFMRQSNINAFYRPYNPLEQYRQAILGVDVKYAFGFWEIVSEAIYSNWTVPSYSGGGFQTVGLSDKFEEFSLSNLGINVDLRFEPPFFTGSYIAARFDHLNFMNESSENYLATKDWDADVTRISAALGYKLGRNIEAKISVSDQSPFDYSLYTFRTTISAFF
tara:strand:+ start:65211 stop:66413 length:1203 start_codon:yes stop_codon:yes gene_type:complete